MITRNPHYLLLLDISVFHLTPVSRQIVANTCYMAVFSGPFSNGCCADVTD